MFWTPETFITFVHHKIHFKTSFLSGIFALLKEYGHISAETWSFLRDFCLFLISELCFVNVLFYFFSSNFTSLAFQKERIRLIKLAKFWFLPEIYFIWKFKLIQHKNKLNAKLNASTGKLSFLNASFFLRAWNVWWRSIILSWKSFMNHRCFSATHRDIYHHTEDSRCLLSHFHIWLHSLGIYFFQWLAQISLFQHS